MVSAPAEQLVTALQPVVWAVDDTGFPKDGDRSLGCSASIAARWPRRPIASWGVGQRRHRAGQLPAGASLVELCGWASCRRIEQDYRELKGAQGLDHFEGRSWPG